MKPHLPSAPQPVRSGYLRTDDSVELHWRAVGSGPPIVCCNGVGVGTFFWKYIVRRFQHDFTIVTWDYRGHGRSERRVDPATTDFSIPRHAQDLVQVVEEICQEPALFIGHSMGCQVSLDAQRQRPDLCVGLVLILGTAGHALETFFDNPSSPRAFRVIHRLLFALGDTANAVSRPVLESPVSWLIAKHLKLVDPHYASKEDMTAYLHHLATLDLRVFIETVLQMQDHSTWDHLESIEQPCLIIAGENDKFTPLWCSYRMVRMLPNAEILVLADASHAAIIEQPETLNHRLDRFFREQLPHWHAAGPATARL